MLNKSLSGKSKLSDWNMVVGYLPQSKNGEGPTDRRRGGRIAKELAQHGFKISSYDPISDQNIYDIIIIAGLNNIDSIISDRLKRSNTYFILDLSDALCLSAGPHLRIISRVMRRIREVGTKLFETETYLGKIGKLSALCDVITVGSTMQAEVFSKYNKNIVVIPDILDEEYGGRYKKVTQDKVCRLVWEGFAENILHFNTIRRALAILSSQYQVELLVYCNEQIPKYFKHAGSVRKYLSTFQCKTIFSTWHRETYVEDLLKGDIGIIPIDLKNKFAAAKPVNKLNIMRMVGLPVIVTPTVAYKEAIREGVDGFLASNTQEWVNKIGHLIKDANLRERIGKAGRKRAFKEASFSKIWNQWLKVFLSLHGRKDEAFPLGR